MFGSPLYKKWEAMKRRCLNKRDKAYQRYGGRGIKICDKWLDFVGFLEDMGGTFKVGLSLDRIDCDGNYEKGNCRWVSLDEQQRNKRTVSLYPYKGEMLSIPQLAKVCGIEKDTLFARLKRYAWSLERAMSVRHTNHRKQSISSQRY